MSKPERIDPALIEVLAMCAGCGHPVRFRIYEPSRSRGDVNPGYCVDHVVVDGVTLCVNCSQQHLEHNALSIPFGWYVYPGFNLN